MRGIPKGILKISARCCAVTLLLIGHKEAGANPYDSGRLRPRALTNLLK